MHPMPHTLAFLLGLSTVFVLFSIPLVLQKVPRNRWYGIRTRPAMQGTEADWYAINRKGGLTFLSIGLLLVPAAYAVGLVQL